MLLSLGVLSGGPWIVNALLASLGLWVLACAGRVIYSPTAGLLAAAMSSLSSGVSTGQQARGDLPTAEQAQGWLQDPQRFPVIIRFETSDARGFLRVGGQANVVVYAGSNPILNAAAALRIRVSTLLSYVR